MERSSSPLSGYSLPLGEWPGISSMENFESDASFDQSSYAYVQRPLELTSTVEHDDSPVEAVSETTSNDSGGYCNLAYERGNEYPIAQQNITNDQKDTTTKKKRHGYFSKLKGWKCLSCLNPQKDKDTYTSNMELNEKEMTVLPLPDTIPEQPVRLSIEESSYENMISTTSEYAEIDVEPWRNERVDTQEMATNISNSTPSTRVGQATGTAVQPIDAIVSVPCENLQPEEINACGCVDSDDESHVTPTIQSASAVDCTSDEEPNPTLPSRSNTPTSRSAASSQPNAQDDATPSTNRPQSDTVAVEGATGSTIASHAAATACTAEPTKASLPSPVASQVPVSSTTNLPSLAKDNNVHGRRVGIAAQVLGAQLRPNNPNAARFEPMEVQGAAAAISPDLPTLLTSNPSLFTSADNASGTISRGTSSDGESPLAAADFSVVKPEPLQASMAGNQGGSSAQLIEDRKRNGEGEQRQQQTASTLQGHQDETSEHTLLPTELSAREQEAEDDEQLVNHLHKKGVTDYPPVPDNIKQFINWAARERGVLCGAIYQAPEDPKELQIIGINADAMKDIITPRIDRFPGFSFSIIASRDPRHLSKEQGGHGIFRVEKKSIQSSRDSTGQRCTILNDDGYCHCGLILAGRTRDPAHPIDAYYVVVPAHLVLGDNLCEPLLDGTGTIEATRKEVEGTASKKRYILNLFNSTDKNDIQPTPMFAYRHFRSNETPDQQMYHFTNDIAVLKIEPHQLRGKAESQLGIKSTQVESEMKERKYFQFGQNDGSFNEHTIRLDDIFPLKNPRTLQKMGHLGVYVVIGPAKGYMVPCGEPISSDGKNWTFAIEFVTFDWEFKDGDCGQIVYVRDTREPYNLYPLGMLIGRSLRKHKCGKNIYRAIVLRQALNEIELHYPHLVSSLRPIGRADNCYTDGDVMVPDLTHNAGLGMASSVACGSFAGARSRSGASHTDTGLGESIHETASYQH